MHQRFADAINSDPDDRATQLIYADWLDQQGDPRAEAWRVLIEQGKRPTLWGSIHRVPESFLGWNWVFIGSETVHEVCNLFGIITHAEWNSEYLWKGYRTFFSAMDAAAVAWVRCHRDSEFMRESEPVKGELK